MAVFTTSHDVVRISKLDHLRGRRLQHQMALDAERLSASDTWSGACMAANAAAERERTQ